MSAYGAGTVRHVAYDANRAVPFTLAKPFTLVIPEVTTYLNQVYRARSTAAKIEQGTRCLKGATGDGATTAIFINLSRTSRISLKYHDALSLGTITLPKGGFAIVKNIDMSTDDYLAEVQSLDEDGADLHVLAWGEEEPS